MNESVIETDVLIVGSGAGGLTAAITAHDQGAQVVVIEKTDRFGGTSAMSDGVLWLPNSPLIPVRRWLRRWCSAILPASPWVVKPEQGAVRSTAR